MKLGFETRKIQGYIRQNVVETSAGRKCVDGRYLTTQARGMIARPGGDFGYVMALLAVNKRRGFGLTAEECFERIYEVVSRGGGHFFMHTDRHADPDINTQKALIGCGHVAKAVNENLAKSYNVDGKDVERLVGYARNMANKTSNIEIINLQGEHEEKGVLVVNSEQYTVNAQDSNSGEMYFIYDEERDKGFLRYLTEKMALQGVNFRDMKKESDLQLAATLHNLAKGLPIYNVTFKGGSPSVEFASFIV